MKNLLNLFGLLIICTALSCRTAGIPGDDGKIEIVFLQVNDVYEIAPLSAGKVGGVARIATVKKNLEQQNPNTFLVIAGDFLSPSIYNSLQYQGKPVRGKQMIDAMNAAGLDLAVFGNHEFDIRENELQERLDESNFLWFSSNTFHKKGNIVQPFRQRERPLPEYYFIDVSDADGTRGRIGLISVTLPFNRADYVSYTPALSSARKIYDLIKDSADVIVALTHQSIEEDIEMAKAIPQLALIMGGHEHDNRFEKEGSVLITKAHANAKSAYVLKIQIDKRKKRFVVDAKLNYLDESVPLDASTQEVVNKWTTIANNNFSSLGFNAEKIIIPAYSGEELDGRETEVRRRSTGLTKLIVKSIEFAAPQADVAIMNGGSIRVDDILQAPLTEYDVLRTLPFGGGIQEAEMKGSLLTQVLEQGKKNVGSGGFLQVSEAVTQQDGRWLLKGAPIDPDKLYRVAFSEFLLTGKEANLDFLLPSNPAILKVYPVATSQADARSDIRLALIRYLNSNK